MIAIVGSGPAGMSAAARAAKDGKPHILLERAPHLNDTIFKYQKHKHVMATPEILPLRSELAFKEESREEVIESWTRDVEGGQVNLRLNAEVTSITGERGNFEITLAGGEKLTAEYVVLAIGVQGNIRKLTIPGADLPLVQYQLDDPEEYKGEEIVLIGTGAAGIENARGLSANNNVTVVNRGVGFPYAKPANAALIQAAIDKGDIVAFSNAEPKRIEPGYLVLETREGEARVKCDRIIGRIGALPPRKFVESCGIVFPSDSPTAYPQVSEVYESQVPGLYVIGALAGYPLIKHCLNQGYEVVEYILGNNIAPADEPLIQAKLDQAKVAMQVPELVTVVREKLALFATLTPLQIREFLIRSELYQKQPGDVVIARGEFANSVYFMLLIDESLCVRCDNCEKACAETHHGVSRLNREAGPTYATLHVPTSCRHCEDPHCMKDCPPDAIHRAPNGEVFIADNCIGCGNCERNCPYGVIQMAATPPEKPGLLRWLLLGMGYGPGEDKSPEAVAKRTGSKHAVKCDMCKDIDGGPACVRACPTGAAIRVAPEQFIRVIQQGGI